jgi:hypothetical protein
MLKHVDMPEMAKTIERLSGGSVAGLVFTPHLVPMTRSVLATMYCRRTPPRASAWTRRGASTPTRGTQSGIIPSGQDLQGDAVIVDCRLSYLSCFRGPPHFFRLPCQSHCVIFLIRTVESRTSSGNDSVIV